MNNNLLFTLNRHIRFQICLIFLVLFGCARAEQIGPTEIPTVTPISGWHMLENEGFQLWVPDSYVGGTSVDIDKVIQQLTQMGPDFAEVAKSIKQSNVKYILFAIDTKSSNPGKVTNMLVGKENVPSSLDVAGYLETLSKNLLSEYSGYRIIQKQTVLSNRYPTGILVTEINTPQTGDVEQIMYAIKNGSAIWQITFTTPASEFDQRSTIFKQIAMTATAPYSSESSNWAGQNNQGVVTLIGVTLVVFGLVARGLFKRRQKTNEVQTKKTAKRKKGKVR